jgi:predicted RND superfamily exporter protein
MTAFERIVRASARRPARVLAVVAVLAVAGGALALRLEPSAAMDTLVGRGADSFQATETYRERFGDHSVIVLASGELPKLVLTSNLGRLVGLEGCLSGNKPEGQAVPGGAGSPCDRLARTKPVQVVYGPGTFINAAAGEINDQIQVQLRTKADEAARAARAARRVARAQGKPPAEQRRLGESARELVYAQFLRDLLQINLRYGLGLTRLPSIDDPDFVSALVFDGSRGAETPKARFAYLFPSRESALIQVRLKPSLSDEEREEAVELVREAVRMPQWRLNDGSYTVTGAPVVAGDLTGALTGSTLRLLVAGLVLMAIVLALVFRSRLRLLPLAVALAAVAITFGATALLGLPLTMASIAVLPVLLGLGVDYAIQYQARVQEEGGAAQAARVAVPVIATAALATGVGFLVLLLSPVPMVRGFGALLVAGIAIAFVLALTAGTAALSLRPREGALARSLRGAGELTEAGARALGRPFAGPAARAAGAAVRGALRWPDRVLVAALLLAVVGWGLDSRTEVVSDLERLVPQDLAAVQDLKTLQQATGVAGEIDVVVEGRDLTDPAVVKWMRDYQAGVLERYGYSSERGCGRADLCPALSLPDLFRSSQSAGDRERIRALLDAVPPYFSRAVITADRRTANLAFGVRLTSLERQQEIIRDLRERLDPPPGVTARLAGLPVLGAEANATLSDPLRRAATLAVGLLAVLLVLLVVHYRRERRVVVNDAAASRGAPAARGSWRRAWDRAWVPVVPIALATGWSALVLWLLRVPLNPLSAMLGALVLAISTEFAVLLSARFEAERAAGHAPAEAIRRTYRSTGAAVLASGATAIAGFAVLALSDVRMLRDFGVVTVVDLTVSLLGVLVVLPAVLVLAERRAAVRRTPEPAAAVA